MVVMPISAASAGYGANNYVNFSGHNKRKNSGDTEGSPIENIKGTNNLAKVPVVVMIAMSPAMLNAKTPVTNLSGLESVKTEMVAAIPSDMEIDETSTYIADFAAQGTQQVKPAPFGITALRGSKIHHVDTFNKNGKKHYIVYYGRKSSSAVESITVFPVGFKTGKGIQLPFVTELVYHDLGGTNDFCGVIVHSVTKQKNGDFNNKSEEIRLPDECAQNLIDLMANYSNLRNDTSIKYTKTTSSKLRPTKIETY